MEETWLVLYVEARENKTSQIEIAFQNAPDMTNPSNRDRIESIAQEFESTSYSIGAKATSLWTREYAKYANLTGT